MEEHINYYFSSYFMIILIGMENAGLALLEFRARITCDPRVALENWNPNDCDPCKWFGVHCIDGRVQML